MTAQASSWAAGSEPRPRPGRGPDRRGAVRGVGDVAGVLGDSRDQRCQARCGPLLQCRRGQQPGKALARGRDSAKVFHMSGTRTGPARDRPAQVAVGVDDRRAAAGADPGATSAALWVPEIVFVAVDLPLRDWRRPGMIRRWHCG